jgi:hypothetical protein
LLELLQKLRRFVEKENLDMVVYCNEDDKWSFTITIILLTSSQGVFDMYFKWGVLDMVYSSEDDQLSFTVPIILPTS